MVVHLFAQCWNDEWMLPFFFRHYDDLVDRYVIYDEWSTDDSWAILQAHPKVAPRRFERAVPDSFALSEQILSNECWKESRGQADWVIVTDIDEHLFHPAWHTYLSRCADEDVTAIPALGFQMLSEAVPGPDEHLAAARPFGAPWTQMMKLSLFDPTAVAEINYGPGRHTANPEGRVRLPDTDEMLLLHYKYMGFERTRLRHEQLRQGLGPMDADRGWGHKYSWSADQLKADWDRVARCAVDVRASGREAARSSDPPWWQPLRER